MTPGPGIEPGTHVQYDIGQFGVAPGNLNEFQTLSDR